LSQPVKVELYAFVLEEDPVVLGIENLDSKHDEPRVVSSSDANVVQVIESHAELRLDEGVGRGV
jgi:hypothetical protein